MWYQNHINTKDFNWRSALSRLCKKFKKQNALHVALHLYLKTQVRSAHHAPKIKVTLTEIADAAADTSIPFLVAVPIEMRTILFYFILFYNQKFYPNKMLITPS